MACYDVVIVGAGLGGLTAGAILARAGRKVLVAVSYTHLTLPTILRV